MFQVVFCLEFQYIIYQMEDYTKSSSIHKGPRQNFTSEFQGFYNTF